MGYLAANLSGILENVLTHLDRHCSWHDININTSVYGKAKTQKMGKVLLHFVLGTKLVFSASPIMQTHLVLLFIAVWVPYVLY